MGSEIIETLAAAIGAAKVRTDDATLRERRHDYWVISHLNDIQGRPAPKPACVVQPDSVDDVVATVNACRESGVALIPLGLGRGGTGLLRTLKQALDPTGFMNPGVLIPDA